MAKSLDAMLNSLINVTFVNMSLFSMDNVQFSRVAGKSEHSAT